ncbi:hypothetical protein M406DRAFT_93660, partial [Cryphonectria parasitica EP155]
MAPVHLSLHGLEITATADPLTREAFSPFGEVVQNPRRDVHPSRFADAGPLPHEAISANQGTAIKYQHVTRMANSYDHAPSGVPGVAVMNMFVCAARKLRSHPPARPERTSSSSTFFEVNILERHPYTTQTFTPLSISGHRGSRTQNSYLVIVAPNLASGSGLQGQQGRGSSVPSPPDLSGLRAFIATIDQAVTYGAGTWHAPMVALGPEGSAVDFVVTQFANGVGNEDCQEVSFGSSEDGSASVSLKNTSYNHLSLCRQLLNENGWLSRVTAKSGVLVNMSPALESTDAKNKLEDLSGVKIEPGENPYNALIKACNDDQAEIQSLYSTHRVTRNGQQKAKFLSQDFKEVLIDPFLLRLENPTLEPGFSDPRNCLVFWARPPDHVVKLVAHLQALLKKAAPSLWLMPTHRVHLTALEVTHSRTPPEVTALVNKMRPTLADLTNITLTHRSRLVKPMLSYDLAAIAVSFLPASGEPVASPPPCATSVTGEHDAKHHGTNDAYTYHHLRRDLFDLAKTTGVDIDSRYVVPSAHITLGRYLTQEDHATPEMREGWVRTIDEINAWLEREVWDQVDGEFVGEWMVGQERGLDARCGKLWYGGGRSLMQGEGF